MSPQSSPFLPTKNLSEVASWLSYGLALSERITHENPLQRRVVGVLVNGDSLLNPPAPLINTDPESIITENWKFDTKSLDR